ncbi:DNA adenine methylase [Acinetobacter baumannii]|uniref:DNA adenine methylase n=1 Tax=Acinetobacter baumannii TaxID=470 RepID=UPI0023400D7F|nr:DNA adenine methylase [Acinetobacter baumannii]MDC4783561.1 DNA adenine methylase [Acinetobacter baumannii]MDC5006488.1 DNA adenine methylase [Acinetobacter baumannii]MDH2619496.1 DNA adenine methylase [Acinetobacter baumannii]
MNLTHQIKSERVPPHLIKYMGSKSNIIEFILNSIDNISQGKATKIYDVFSGTCIVSAYLNQSYDVVINDIQEYSSYLGKSYLNKIDPNDIDINIFLNEVNIYKEYFKKKYNLNYFYEEEISLENYLIIESQEKSLLYFSFDHEDHHLFVKNYSGTYWSFQQCLEIDAIYRVAQNYRNKNIYEILIGSLMFAMSYCSQSTGHFAQYRDVKDQKNFKDIMIYRVKSMSDLFISKFNHLINYDRSLNHNFESYTMSFDELLEKADLESVIYADPPYANVHYSRFYHVLETLVKYDYPEVKFKGRYRQDRHQSPFSKKKEAIPAFEKMFTLIKEKNSRMVLSYSDGGVIDLDTLLTLAKKTFGETYKVSIETMEYLHSRLGRTGGKNINVNEILIIADKI